MFASQIVIRLDAKEYAAGVHDKKFLESVKRSKTVVRSDSAFFGSGSFARMGTGAVGPEMPKARSYALVEYDARAIQNDGSQRGIAQSRAMESFHAYLSELNDSKKKAKRSSYQIYKMTSPIFTTKSKKFDPGQYLIPFSFRIPCHAPGSFSYLSHHGERFGIEYSVKVSFTKVGEGSLS